MRRVTIGDNIFFRNQSGSPSKLENFPDGGENFPRAAWAWPLSPLNICFITVAVFDCIR